MTPPFGTFFRTCVCGAASPQIGRLLQQIGRLLQQIGRLLQQIGRLLQQIGRLLQQIGRLLQQIGRLLLKIGRLLLKIGRLLLKTRKASEEAFHIFGRSGTYVASAKLVYRGRGRTVSALVSAYVRLCDAVLASCHIMAALSKYAKQRIVSLKERGLTNREVVAILKREGTVVHVTTQIVQRCHKRYAETGSIARRQGSGRLTLRTAAHLQTIEDIMQADDEATAVQIRSYLLQRGQRLLSLSTILRARHELGWTYRGSAYCQLIRQANKEKRFEWARAHLHVNFEDVLWTDESSVQLQCHKRFCCRKKGEQPGISNFCLNLGTG